MPSSGSVRRLSLPGTAGAAGAAGADAAVVAVVVADGGVEEIEEMPDSFDGFVAAGALQLETKTSARSVTVAAHARAVDTIAPT